MRDTAIMEHYIWGTYLLKLSIGDDDLFQASCILTMLSDFQAVLLSSSIEGNNKSLPMLWNAILPVKHMLNDCVVYTVDRNYPGYWNCMPFMYTSDFIVEKTWVC